MPNPLKLDSVSKMMHSWTFFRLCGTVQGQTASLLNCRFGLAPFVQICFKQIWISTKLLILDISNASFCDLEDVRSS